jgi:hypothetical protein
MDKDKIPIIWLNGKTAYTAIIPKKLLRDKLGPDDIDKVAAEIKDSILLIKNNSNVETSS